MRGKDGSGRVPATSAKVTWYIGYTTYTESLPPRAKAKDTLSKGDNSNKLDGTMVKSW